MELISLQDREYLENKFHRTDEPFDAFRRMQYHGYEYDPATGMTDEEIKAGLAMLAAEMKDLPHPVQKARLFAYVLDHTRIDVNEHDYFIGLYSWSRLIYPYTVTPWSKAVYDSFPQATQRLHESFSAGADYGGLDFDHTIPDWDSLMEMGFPGILDRITQQYETLKAQGQVSEKQEAFFRGVEITYQAVIRFIDRLYRYALTKNFEKAPKIAQCLKNLRDGAPKTTYDAMQMIYLYFIISESVDQYQVRSLGYGIDQTLYPFFKRDIESGEATKEEVANLLSYFLMQWSAIGNYWGQPMYMGGMNADGTTKVNELSYLVLDVYNQLGIYNPKIQIKVNGSTPKEFVQKALDMIRGGVSSIVFCNDDVITDALMSRGATYEQAGDSAVSGCYEYRIKGRTICISNLYVNLLKPVSLVLDNGLDVATGYQIGPKTGDAETFSSFEAFYHAYIAQLKYLIEADCAAVDEYHSRVDEINPSLLYSATNIHCVNTLTDALDCGIDNDSVVLISGLGTAVDALMAVYELVYEKKAVSMQELRKALHANWQGYELLRAKALKSRRKFGNGDSMADAYARRIVRYVTCDLLSGKRNCHGGRYVVDLHSARAFIIHGSKTMATPDGRRAGDETSKNASPTPGADRSGITALIRSSAGLNARLCMEGFCLDAMLHPSAVQGADGMEALYSVLKTYMEQGGGSIHFNIFNADVLRDAQKNPEKYRTLQVRVCGWNVLWNNMCKEEQDAYILRAENIL